MFLSSLVKKHEWKFGRTTKAVGTGAAAFYDSIEAQRTCMFSISFRKHHDEEKENNLITLIIKMNQNVVFFARAIITSTARVSSVFSSSYGNTIFKQSARVFCWHCLLK